MFSYTHTDLIARYKRMQGFNVFYPMGFDDNGLPTERRVQNYFWVRPDISAPYDPNFKPPYEGTDGLKLKPQDQVPVSRQNFIELCEKLSHEDELKFKELWQRLGISVDWSLTYQTIDEKSRRIAQKAFLRNLSRGEAYQMEAPGLWDITFQTAVAQAELEAREYAGHFHKVAFKSSVDGSEIVIETTRPELLISCVALIAHPDDERYKPLFGKNAISPVFGVEVPILPHIAAQMDKGSGIVMCCTFGDQTDIQWWRELELPLRSVMSRNGRLNTEDAIWVTDTNGMRVRDEINGKTAFSAKEIVVQHLRECGALLGDPTSTMRMTNYFEKGEKPLEIVTSRQWYITNGGKDEDLQGKLLDYGKKLDFVPDFMRVRYENWVQGLNNDWLVSRQRFFGVAFPIWYKVREDGEVDYDTVITPDESALPIDPTIHVPDGYTEDQRGKPNGFVGEADIMDTWATSSLTPQIAANWEESDSDFDTNAVYPMDLRPQGQDIIRTWLFSTVLRSLLENDSLPWSNAAISGWILDPDRKKMSKSKGNVVTPMDYLEQFGSDAVRYWASGAKLGTDATFDEGQMKIGRRLAMKVLNVTKFVLGMELAPLTELAKLSKLPENEFATKLMEITEFNEADFTAVDLSLLTKLKQVADKCANAFDNYDHFAALEGAEQFFWEFCDDYVELVKRRAYNQPGVTGSCVFTESESRAAKITLLLVLRGLIKLLAPFIPFATDEAWSWFNDCSVHKTSYGTNYGLAEEDISIWEFTTTVLEKVRREKSNHKVAMNTPILSLTAQISTKDNAYLEAVLADLKSALNITNFNTEIVTDEGFNIISSEF